MTSIEDVFKWIKSNSWLKIPSLPAIEQYVLSGDKGALGKIKASPHKSFMTWGDRAVDALKPVGQWEDVDRRIVHALAASEEEEAVWTWIDQNVEQEKEGEDWMGAVLKELNAGRKQCDVMTGVCGHVQHFRAGGHANSVGRFLLAASDKEVGAAVRTINQERRWDSSLEKLTEFLHLFAPQRTVTLAKELLLTENEEGLALEVVQVLLKADPKTFGPMIAGLLKDRTHTFSVFKAAEALFAVDRTVYRALALSAARAALMVSGRNDVAATEFMITHFGREVLPDLLKYMKESEDPYAELEVLEVAVKAFGIDMIDALQTTLDRFDKTIAKLSKSKSGSYSERSQLERAVKSRTNALGMLILMNDGSLNGQIEAELLKGMGSEDSGNVIAHLNLASKGNFPGVNEAVWKLLEHKSKPVRDTAARILARGGEGAVEKATALLQHKKADARMAAAIVLSTVNTPAALAALEARMEKEENDDVRDQMLLGLEAAWAKQGRKMSRADIGKRVARMTDKLDRPVADWVKVASLPKLKWADGGELDQQTISYLLYRQSRAKEIRPDIEARPLYGLIDRASSGEFAKAILAGFIGSKQEAGDRWALTVAAMLGDNGLVPALAGQIREWVDNNRGKLAEYAVKALALLGTDAALLAVDAMAIRYRNKMKNVGKAASEAFEGAAEALGITTEELGDRVVPWFGFEAGKARIIETGGGKYEASIGMDFKLAYKDLTKNKVVKSLPKSVDAKVAAEMKEINANLKEATKSQLLRLENLLVRQRRWPVGRWKELFLAHPLLLPFAVRLVWAHYDESGKLIKLFRGLEDRSLTTVEDEAYEPAEAGTIGMVHPLELDEATRKAWQNHLADYEIEPPFAQLERQVVRVKEDEKERKTYKEVAGKTLNAMTFKGRAEKLGWHRGSVCDGGGITSYVKSFPTAGADVILLVEGFYVGIDMYSDMNLGDVMFVKSGSVEFGSYTYDEPSKEEDARVLKFGEVPAIVFSEVMGDLAKISGKGEAAEGDGR